MINKDFLDDFNISQILQNPSCNDPYAKVHFFDSSSVDSN